MEAPLTFAAIGDFGTGVRKPSTEGRRQREVAAALEAAVAREDIRLLLTTGDNIYAGRTLLGIPVGSTGDEDDDWFFTFFQPYRYVINRIPVHPCIGNHDGDETEVNDDRDQIIDNFYLTERLLGEEAAGRASVGPGLFYRFRFGSQIEFVALDSSRRFLLFGERFFRHVNHAPFLEAGVPAGGGGHGAALAHPVRAPPAVLRGAAVGELEAAASSTSCRSTGARACGWSSADTSTTSSIRAWTGSTTSSPAAEERCAPAPPTRFEEAHTVKWASAVHFLLVRIDGGAARRWCRSARTGRR